MAPVQPLYERVLQRDPGHAAALLDLPGCTPVFAAGDAAPLEDIERQAFEPVH